MTTKRRWLIAAACLGGLLVLLAAGLFTYMKLVEGAWIPFNKWDRRERGALQAGLQAPDLDLPLLTEGTVRLSDLWRDRPLVLIFGSCT